MSQINDSINLDTLEQLIKNRKIANLKVLFKEEQQRKQADRMFHYYNRKGWKDTSIAQIVFRDETYIVVRTLSGYNNYLGVNYHAMVVIGIDAGQVWIHRIEWDQRFEDDNYNWTIKDIRQKMGFTDELQQDTLIEKGKSVRIQGDVSVTLVETIEDVQNRKIESKRRDLAYEFRELEKTRLLKEFESEISEKEQVFEIDIQELKDIHSMIKETKAATISKRQIKLRYGMAKVTINKVIDELGNRKAIISRTIIEREKDKPEYTQRENEYINRMLENTKDQRPKTRQTNIMLGNHLIIIENAAKSRGDFGLRMDNQIDVYDTTKCIIIHDEHSNREFYLNAGVYRFGLLQRHRTDRR